jgi:hypothetical protein
MKTTSVSQFSGKNMTRLHVFENVNYNSKPSIEKMHRNPRTGFWALDEIFDPETDTNRIIRYVPGEKSIYLDEQTNQDLGKKYYIQFINGFLYVSPMEKTLLEFIQKCNFNEACEYRMPGKEVLFRKQNHTNTARKLMTDDRQIMKAKAAAYDMPIEELVAYARVLNINVDRDPEEIRYHMSVIAGEDPDTFLQGLSNPSTKRKHWVLAAIDRGVITLDRNTRKIKWSNGQAICTAPYGIDPIDHFVDLTFEAEGEEVYSHLKKLVDPKVEDNQEREAPKMDPYEGPGLDVEKLGTLDLFENCVKYGVLGKNGNWYVYDGENIAMGKKKATEKIDSDEDLNKNLRKSLLLEMS